MCKIIEVNSKLIKRKYVFFEKESKFNNKIKRNVKPKVTFEMHKKVKSTLEVKIMSEDFQNNLQTLK